MAVICPTITAFDPHEYRQQVEQVQDFAKRLHIDLMDGNFAPSKSPGLEQVWWPEQTTADIHLMYRHPAKELEQLVKLKPHMVIIHAEADVDHAEFVDKLHKADILAGIALLQDTAVTEVGQLLRIFDHILVFSGHLGYHGGKADLSLLDKVKEVKQVNPTAEISWDGGITDQNAKALIAGGVTVLNVGGFIQKAANPKAAYGKLKQVIET